MSSAIDPWKSQLGSLPSTERAELALFLIRSLDDQADDAGAEDAWEQELARRVAEVKSGAARSRPAADVFREVRDAQP